MKFFSFIVAPLFFLTAVLAQNINIATPTAGQSFAPGSNFTVEVDRPNSLTGSQNVAIVVGLRSCTDNAPCTSPEDALGNVLYWGPYTPEYIGSAEKPPHQNFTVQVPTFFQAGRALLSVSHFMLLGAGPQPILEIKNVTINIAA